MGFLNKKKKNNFVWVGTQKIRIIIIIIKKTNSSSYLCTFVLSWRVACNGRIKPYQVFMYATFSNTGKKKLLKIKERKKKQKRIRIVVFFSIWYPPLPSPLQKKKQDESKCKATCLVLEDQSYFWCSDVLRCLRCACRRLDGYYLWGNFLLI